MPQPRKKYYSKTTRKRKHYSGLEYETESDESDSYVEVQRRSKQQQQKNNSLWRRIRRNSWIWATIIKWRWGKADASVTYSDKKQLEFILDLTANTYTN